MFDSGIKTTNCLRNMLSFKTMVTTTTISIESYNLKDKSEAMASTNPPP